MQTVRFEGGFEGWRDAARVLLAYRIAPAAVQWQAEGETSPMLWSAPELEWKSMRSNAPTLHLKVSRDFLGKAYAVSFHRDPERWQLLYNLIWRLTYENPKLLDLSLDDHVQRFMSMEHAVRRDAHKAKAFVRFRKIQTDEGEVYCAWHEPAHPILPYVAPFFQDRFAVMRWTILTPDQSVHWDGERLSWGPGCAQEAGPQGDQLEELWGTYYKSIFNPARVKLKAMTAEMPKKYWHSMPETRLIEELVFESDARVDAMIRATPKSAADFLPETRDIASLKAAIPGCKACELCAKATQAVFGAGDPTAQLMLVGEQPGDQEDQIGLPFQGPAGEVLQRALDNAGIVREEIYMTNAVKAFKYRREGKRRIHEKPNAREVGTCKAWLQSEMQAVGPKVVLCLGLTAALAVLGKSVRLMDVNGKVMDMGEDLKVIVTHHPSHILRIPLESEKQAAMAELETALRLAYDLSSSIRTFPKEWDLSLR